jgi:hypothetical protein
MKLNCWGAVVVKCSREKLVAVVGDSSGSQQRLGEIAIEQEDLVNPTAIYSSVISDSAVVTCTHDL